MQAERDICVLGSIGRCRLHRHLVEGQLLCALACDILKVDGFPAQILQGQAIHVVARGRGIQHIGFQHRVEGDSPQGNIMIGQYTSIILQVLSDLGQALVLEQGLELRQDLVPVQLRRGSRVVVTKGDIGGLPRFNAERNAHHPGLHVVKAGGLSIKGEQVGAPQPVQPGIQRRLVGDNLPLQGRLHHGRDALLP